MTETFPSSTPASAMPLVRLNAVKLAFDEGRVIALNGVDLEIADGETISIVGRSGSGKSSLASIITGIEVPTEGTILWRGVPVEGVEHWRKIRRSEVGIVFQEYNLLPTLTALENVEIVLFGRDLTAAQRHEMSVAALDDVGLGARLDHLPGALSGGERQRVAISRAIVHRPALLMADEPTGSLDSANGKLISDLLFHLQQANHMTLVIVTHDETLAARCGRQIRLFDGKILRLPHQSGAPGANGMGPDA